jgi:hypothetical protein
MLVSLSVAVQTFRSTLERLGLPEDRLGLEAQERLGRCAALLAASELGPGTSISVRCVSGRMSLPFWARSTHDKGSAARSTPASAGGKDREQDEIDLSHISETPQRPSRLVGVVVDYPSVV